MVNTAAASSNRPPALTINTATKSASAGPSSQHAASSSSSSTAPTLPQSAHTLQQQQQQPPPGFTPNAPLLFDRAPLQQPLVPAAADAFMPEEFLAEYRHLSLQELRSELDFYLFRLRIELTELINRDYADFISLSTNLNGVDKLVDDLRLPLAKTRDDLQIVRKNLAGIVDVMNEKLNGRNEIREKKAILELFLDIADSVKKVEDLLDSNAQELAVKSGSENSDAARGKIAERIAVEFNQLIYLTGRGKGLPFVASLSRRISRIAESLSFSLDSSLKNAISSRDSGSLQQCLRTYYLVERCADAENVIREILVRPLVSQTLSKKALQANVTATEADGDLARFLPQCYDKIIDFVRLDCAEIIEITTTRLGGNAFDVLTNCIWSQISATVLESKELSTIMFSVGLPDYFHRNYTDFARFLYRFEGFYSSHKDLNRLRASASYTDFMKRWQLAVYFQIRFREVSGRMESRFGMPLDEKDDGRQVILGATGELISCVEYIWDEKIFIRELGHRFWKLALQLLCRYGQWIDSLISQRTSMQEETGADRTAGNKDAPASQLRQDVFILHDVHLVQKKYPALLQDTILKQLPLESTKQDDLSACLRVCFKQYFTANIETLTVRIVEYLSSACSEHLSLLRNITAQYSRTNREAPTRHSPFVEDILESLRRFQSEFEPRLKAISAETLLRFTQDVVAKVAGNFLAITVDILDTIKKREDALLRLKRPAKKTSAQPGAGGAADEVLSDEDKIRLQLWLNAEQFGHEVKQLGIEPESLEAWKSLMSAIQSARNKQ